MNSLRIDHHLIIDLHTQRLYNEQKQSYTKIEPLLVQLIEFFIDNKDRLISRGELSDRFWSSDVNADESLTQAITKIRRLLDDTGKQKRFILTIPKLGYKWIAASVYSDQDPEIDQIDRRRNIKSINWVVALIVIYFILRIFFPHH